MSESARTINAERSQRETGGKCWWWLTGDTYPHRDLLKRHGARFSSRRRAWYWIGETLPAAIQALVGEPEVPSPEPVLPPALKRQILDVLADDDARRTAAPAVEPLPDITAAEPPERPMIRVSKPASPPSDGALDAVQHAIRAVKQEPTTTPSAPSASMGRLARIDQAFCGEITGSITGQVFCYGYVRRESVRNNC